MVMEAIHIGRHSKISGDVIYEDFDTWEQRFVCRGCGAVNVWFPDGGWREPCECLAELLAVQGIKEKWCT
jgi:hypothetical protein